MTLKLMTQQVLENFLVAPQCLDLIELSSSLVKRGASHRECPMNKSKRNADDIVDSIGNSTISHEQGIITKMWFHFSSSY